MAVMSALPVVMFIWVNPRNTGRLRLEDELNQVKRALRNRSVRFILEFAVTVDTLRILLLEHSPQLVHFSGHGVEAGIKLEDEHGMAATVDGEALADLFGLCRKPPQCVVFNVCFSESVASAIGQHVPYVVAMRDEIGDEAAKKFSAGFYDALAQDYSYSRAYEIGRNAIDLTGIAESRVPILVRRPEAQELRLFSPTNDERPRKEYRAFVQREFTAADTARLVLPRALEQIPLSLRVDSSTLAGLPPQTILDEEELAKFCHTAAGQQEARLIVSGEPGSGKTSLLQHIAMWLAARNDSPLPLYLPIGSILKEGRFVTRWLEHRMQPGSPAAEGLSDLLSVHGEAGQLVVLIDGLDALGGEVHHYALVAVSSLMELWPRAVFLVAARPYTSMQMLGGSFARLEIQALAREQQLRFLSAQLGQNQASSSNPIARVEDVMHQLERDPSLRELAGTCLGLRVITSLAEQQADLGRSSLRLIEQFIRFLLTGRAAAGGLSFPQPEATLFSLRLLAFKLTGSVHDSVSIEQLEQFLYEDDASAVRQKLELHPPWREGGVRAFLYEQAEKLGILGPYERTRDTAAARWRFVHDAFCDALAAAELKSRHGLAALEQAAALVDRSRETAASFYEPVTLLVADSDSPDDLAMRLQETNPELGMRLLQRVPHLAAPTIFALLGARGNWQQRGRVFARLREQLGNAHRAADLLDRIRSNTRDGNDLFFIDRALACIALEEPELGELVVRYRRAIFAHIPRPTSPWMVETAAGRVPLFCRVPAGEVERAPDSLFPWFRRLRADSGYLLSCVPITRAYFAAFDPAYGPSSWRPNYPVDSITWYEATMFCRWLGTLEPQWAGARLPREVEWEYACLYGASGQPFCCGDTLGLRSVAWYKKNAAEQLHLVARLKPSGLGLYDLHGNVREWCLDLWEPPTAGSELLTFNPRLAFAPDSDDGFKGLRGGCFLDEAEALQVGTRAQAAPSLQSKLFGCRVLIPQMPPDEPTAASVAGSTGPPARITK